MFFAIKWKKTWIFLLTFGIIGVIAIEGIQSRAEQQRWGSEILQSLGYDVTDQPIEVEDVRLAEADSAVFLRYNALQKESGFDLLPYAGKTVTRVTYLWQDGDLSWRINLLFDGGIFLGGDQCSVSLDGMMLPLKGNNNENR